MVNARFLSRRSFLRGTAGVVVGLPLLESIGSGPLKAQEDGSRLTRFLSFHCSSGVDTRRFWPGMGELTAESLEGRALEALSPYVDRLLIPRGIHGYPVGTFTGHDQGTGQALTAAAIRGGRREGGARGPDGMSIDQIIALELTEREAMVLKPGGRDLGNNLYNSISYSAPREQFTAESDPLRAYGAMMGFGATAALADQSQATASLLERRMSVLDLALEEFTELQSLNLSRTDRLKLERHSQLIRDIETRITGDGDLIGCELEASTLGQIQGLDRERVEANENFPITARLMVRIAALALACRYSRSVALQWGAAVAGSPMYQWDGINHAFRHHPLSHGTSEDFGGDMVAGFRDQLFEIDTWNIGELKKLLDLLDGYEESEGRTLLDNTVTLYTNEFSDGQGHTTGDLPVMVIGGAGYFLGGRSILVAGSSTGTSGVQNGQGNSNKLLCTVLNAVGVPTSRFSDGPAGEFTELRAPLDC